MIALILALQTVPTLQALDPQTLPARGCAAYLWSRVDRRFVAVATADPAGLRLALDGRVADYPRESQSGAGGFGLTERATYRAGEVALTLDMTIAPRAELTDGATVPDATLTVARAGSDAIVVPVAGLIGCTPTRGVEIAPGSVR